MQFYNLKNHTQVSSFSIISLGNVLRRSHPWRATSTSDFNSCSNFWNNSLTFFIATKAGDVYSNLEKDVKYLFIRDMIFWSSSSTKYLLHEAIFVKIHNRHFRFQLLFWTRDHWRPNLLKLTTWKNNYAHNFPILQLQYRNMQHINSYGISRPKTTLAAEGPE